MKLGIFSDLHVHNWPEFARPSELVMGMNTRAEEIFNSVMRIEAVVEERGLDVLLFCGDWFEARGRLAVPLIRMSQLVIGGLTAQIPVYAVSGNHDFASRQDMAVSSLDLFGRDERFRVLYNEYIIHDGIKIAGIPAQQPFHPIPNDTSELPGILMLHTLFSGERIGKHTIEDGESLDTVKAYMKKMNYPLCMVGDNHVRRDYGDGVWSVGSPIQHGFGEESEKGMLVVDMDTRDVEFVPLGGPRFLTVDEGFSDFEEGSYYRVRSKNYEKVLKTLADRPNIRVEPPPKEIKSKKRSDVDLGMKPEEALNIWLKVKELKPVDHKRILKLGKEILGD
jgi:DNA repair exonuclease SbcCD nuclease subunit